MGGVRVSTGRGCLLARESESHLRPLRNVGAGEDTGESAPFRPTGVSEVVTVPAGGDTDAGRCPAGACPERRVIFDGALKGAMEAPRIGGADDAQAATAEGWYVQADIGTDNDGGNWFPEK